MDSTENENKNQANCGAGYFALGEYLHARLRWASSSRLHGRCAPVFALRLSANKDVLLIFYDNWKLMMIARAGSTAPNTKKEVKSGGLYLFFGAGDGNWTRTVKPHAPQTCASASSATPAEHYTLYNINFDLSIVFWKVFWNILYFFKNSLF